MKDNAIQEFVDAIKEPYTETDKTYSATVSHIDEEGRVWVYLAGSTIETPTESTSSEVKRGDLVTVEWRNNKLYIAGNYSNPSAGVVRVTRVENTARIAKEAANNAVFDAGRAREAAEQAEETAASVEGIAREAIRDATAVKENLRSVVQGATTVEKAVSVMQTAMESIIDYDPNTTQESFDGDGSETDFALANEATDILSVTVDDEEVEYTSATSENVTVVTIDPAPADGSEVVINYEHATVQEWFWHDANGAHVLGDTSGYRNDMKSTGMDIVKVENERSVAQFGAEGSRIGRPYDESADDNESHIEVDYRSMKMFDKEGNKYLHISDLRDPDGTYYTEEKYRGDGSKKTFYLGFLPICEMTEDTSPVAIKKYYKKNDDGSYSMVSASELEGKNPHQEGWYEPEYTVTFSYDDEEQHTDPIIEIKSRSYVSFEDYVSTDTTVVISYRTESSATKAYTFGTRADTSTSFIGAMSVAEGLDVIASGKHSHAEGGMTQATAAQSHAEGVYSIASGTDAHAEGASTEASGYTSHSEGNDTAANGSSSHAEGSRTTANGYCSHAEGYSTTTAYGAYGAHAEGASTEASGYTSHSEGRGTTASAQSAHAEGEDTVAKGYYSHAQNYETVAAKHAQTALGTYNEEDESVTTTHPNGRRDYGQYAVMIGNGTSDSNRSNALTVDWNGNVLTSGGVNARGTVVTGTDLDSVTRVGTYYLSGNNTYTNAPASFGILEVIAYDTNGSILMQRVTQDSRQWTRRRTASNTWTTWQLTNTYGIISEDILLADNQTVNSSSYANGSLSVAKTGYTPIGVVGYHLQNASSSGANNTLCAMHSCYLSGSSCYWVVRNTGGSNAKIKVTATILYTIA